MSFQPQDKVAVVTGSAGGIGLGMARAFARAGMHVVLADVEADRLEASAAALRADGHDAIGIVTDVTRRDSVEALAEATMDAHGRINVLCNNAGVGIFSKISETSIEDWEWTVAINLWGPIYGVKTFLPLIQRNEEAGHINSTASIAGLIAGATAGPYNVTKHGVVALMATLERELRASKVPHRASVLCPGPINTSISRNSVRNRRAAAPASTEALPEPNRAKGSESGRKLTEQLTTALASGMDPDIVGELVLSAMVEERFWIFTHPGLLRVAREQFEVLQSDGMLSRGRLF